LVYERLCHLAFAALHGNIWIDVIVDIHSDPHSKVEEKRKVGSIDQSICMYGGFSSSQPLSSMGFWSCLRLHDRFLIKQAIDLL
jgi:hypothetical protein